VLKSERVPVWHVAAVPFSMRLSDVALHSFLVIKSHVAVLALENLFDAGAGVIGFSAKETQ